MEIKKRKKIRLKTGFWEEIDVAKVSKIFFYLNIMTVANIIAFLIKKSIIMAIINTLIFAFLTMIHFSYQKYEGEKYREEKEREQWEKQKKKQKKQ